MKQISSILAVLEVFFKEPTTLHFIREIGRKIDLAQPSTKNYVKALEHQQLVIKRKSKPFDGFVANRDMDSFIFYKRAYNLYSLLECKKRLIEALHPSAIVLFGSYSRGEDVESSDVDILIVSKLSKHIDFSDIEEKLKRKIHLTILNDLSDIDINMRSGIKNGIVLYGEMP